MRGVVRRLPVTGHVNADRKTGIFFLTPSSTTALGNDVVGLMLRKPLHYFLCQDPACILAYWGSRPVGSMWDNRVWLTGGSRVSNGQLRFNIRDYRLAPYGTRWVGCATCVPDEKNPLSVSLYMYA